MSYVLYRGDDKAHDIHLTGCAFCECLGFGQAFGWDPMGTVDPFDNPEVGFWDSKTEGEWPGHYAEHCLQTVREDDARAFSTALFRGLDSICGKKLTPQELEAIEKDFPDFNEKSFLAMVHKVAEFAAEGAFQIC